MQQQEPFQNAVNRYAPVTTMRWLCHVARVRMALLCREPHIHTVHSSNVRDRLPEANSPGRLSTSGAPLLHKPSPAAAATAARGGTGPSGPGAPEASVDLGSEPAQPQTHTAHSLLPPNTDRPRPRHRQTQTSDTHRNPDGGTWERPLWSQSDKWRRRRDTAEAGPTAATMQTWCSHVTASRHPGVTSLFVRD